MAMNRFAYASAPSIQEALGVLDDACRPLAGGTDLLEMIKEGLIAPARLVNLKQIADLGDVEACGHPRHEILAEGGGWCQHVGVPLRQALDQQRELLGKRVLVMRIIRQQYPADALHFRRIGAFE